VKSVTIAPNSQWIPIEMTGFLLQTLIDTLQSMNVKLSLLI